jgi:hypothetical protein
MGRLFDASLHPRSKLYKSFVDVLVMIGPKSIFYSRAIDFDLIRVLSSRS